MKGGKLEENGKINVLILEKNETLLKQKEWKRTKKKLNKKKQ